MRQLKASIDFLLGGVIMLKYGENAQFHINMLILTYKTG